MHLKIKPRSIKKVAMDFFEKLGFTEEEFEEIFNSENEKTQQS